jgi:hypothetical protein
MALTSKTGAEVGPKGLVATPDKYISLGTLIDPTKPDVRDLYVSTFGDQGITGFLDLTGAKKSAGTSDETVWYEEGRLHRTLTASCAASEGTITYVDGVAVATHPAVNAAGVLRVNDVLLWKTGVRSIVTAVAGGTAFTFTTVDLDGTGEPGTIASGQVNIIGNAYAQGTDQPSTFYQTALTKRVNPFIITKDTFHVTGSQATNIGWLNVNGDYRWYMKNEMDARKRFMNQREAMLMYSQLPAYDAPITLGGTIVGSEGYFAAVEDRGIVADNVSTNDADFAALNDMDEIILALDKEGAPSEYAMYLDRRTSLIIDTMLATGVGANITAGLASQFGAFNNSQDMAVNLGFKSFTRGGYTFHKHDWKMLNDPTVGGTHAANKTALAVTGAMIPMSQVADAKSGQKAPSLEMNYKAAGNYSRDLDHWVEGGGVLGFATNGEDMAKFHYRSECNLVTRAANQHVLLKK